MAVEVGLQDSTWERTGRWSLFRWSIPSSTLGIAPCTGRSDRTTLTTKSGDAMCGWLELADVLSLEYESGRSWQQCKQENFAEEDGQFSFACRSLFENSCHFVVFNKGQDVGLRCCPLRAQATSSCFSTSTTASSYGLERQVIPVLFFFLHSDQPWPCPILPTVWQSFSPDSLQQTKNGSDQQTPFQFLMQMADQKGCGMRQLRLHVFAWEIWKAVSRFCTIVLLNSRIGSSQGRVNFRMFWVPKSVLQMNDRNEEFKSCQTLRCLS